MGIMDRFGRNKNGAKKYDRRDKAPKITYEDFYQEFSNLDEYLKTIMADEKFTDTSFVDLMSMGINKFLEKKGIDPNEPEVWNVITSVSRERFFSTVDKSLDNAGYLDWEKSLVDFEEVRSQHRSPYEFLPKEDSKELQRYATLIYLARNRFVSLNPDRNYSTMIYQEELIKDGLEKYKRFIFSQTYGRVKTILDSEEFNVRKYLSRGLSKSVDQMLEISKEMKSSGESIESIELSPDKVIDTFDKRNAGSELSLNSTYEMTRELYDRLYDMSHLNRKDFDSDTFRLTASLYFAFGKKMNGFPSEDYRRNGIDWLKHTVERDINSSNISNALSRRISDKESLRFINLSHNIDNLYEMHGKEKEDYRSNAIEENEEFSRVTPEFARRTESPDDGEVEL